MERTHNLVFIFICTFYSVSTCSDNFVTTLVARCKNRHTFHGTCFERWRAKKGYGQCPMCRAEEVVVRKTTRISKLPSLCAVCLDTEEPNIIKSEVTYRIAFGRTTRNVLGLAQVNVPQWELREENRLPDVKSRYQRFKGGHTVAGFKFKKP